MSCREKAVIDSLPNRRFIDGGGHLAGGDADKVSRKHPSNDAKGVDLVCRSVEVLL